MNNKLFLIFLWNLQNKRKKLHEIQYLPVGLFAETLEIGHKLCIIITSAILRFKFLAVSGIEFVYVLDLSEIRGAGTPFV